MTQLPRPSLADHVECIDYQSASRTPGAPPTRILPTGTMDLVFHFGDPFVRYGENGQVTPEPTLCLTGQRTRPVEVAATGRTGVIVVRLKPWTLGTFTNESAAAFNDRATCLASVFPPDWCRRVEDTLDAAKNPAARIGAIEDALERLIDGRATDLLVTGALKRLYSASDMPGALELAQALGLSKRQLDRRFGRVTGLSIKQFSRVLRFQRALGANAVQSEADRAAAAGYWDQSHMIRDFQQFTGLTPRRVVERRGRSPLTRHYARPANMSRFYNTLYLH